LIVIFGLRTISRGNIQQLFGDHQTTGYEGLEQGVVASFINIKVAQHDEIFLLRSGRVRASADLIGNELRQSLYLRLTFFRAAAVFNMSG
jgi:hypothetical protein